MVETPVKLAEMADDLEPLLVYAWRRHLAAAIARMLADADPDEADQGVTRVVGFADLVNFTALVRRMTERQLAVMVQRLSGAISVAAFQMIHLVSFPPPSGSLRGLPGVLFLHVAGVRIWVLSRFGWGCGLFCVVTLVVCCGHNFGYIYNGLGILKLLSCNRSSLSCVL